MFANFTIYIFDVFIVIYSFKLLLFLLLFFLYFIKIYFYGKIYFMFFYYNVGDIAEWCNVECDNAHRNKFNREK